MIDLQILEEHGLTHANLKKWFDEDPATTSAVPEAQRNAITELRNHIRGRVQQGRDWNLKNHSVYHALDLAWDAPFRQVSPTLLQSLMNLDATDPKGDVAQKLAGWGIDLKSVIQDVPDPKTPGRTTKQVNVPAFFQVFVPLVRAYVTIRWAKIINDRRLVPFFKFEPAIDTRKNRMKCDVITSRVEVMARQLGYFEVMKQSVFQMLHYGTCLQFPVEEWYSEEQLVRGSESDQPEVKEETETVSLVEPVPAPKTETKSSGKTKKIVVKEGIRHHMPHPTRMFWDQAHRISTFNSDTGCEFAGYWRVLRFRDVHTNTAFWNRELIPLGTSNWWDRAYTYFATVYKCSLKFPSPTTPEDSKDREANMVNSFYSGANNLDHAVMLTEYFEKIVPKAWGLGTYDHPVWFRFVVCGDSGTVIYAAPLPYCPVVAYAYDADELREQNASLSLEVLPFQDQFSNLLTQYLLTVQHNLTNLTMVDKDQFEDPKVLDELENNWAKRWVRRTILRFSGRKSMKAQQSTPNAAFSINFQPLDSNGIIQAMKIILDTLERVLVMSSQEVAQAASHEQTREEIRNLAASTSSRLQFSTTPVDLAAEAWKRQLFQGLMAYGDGEFYAQVPFETALDKKTIEELGFTIEDETDEKDQMRERQVTVRVKDKTAIALESFASTRDGNDRINNVESAVAMATFVRDIVNGPFGPNIGADQFIRISNEIARLAGFPRDFKLVNKAPGSEPGSPEQQKAEAKEQLMQIVQAVEAQVVPKIFDALKQPFSDLQAGVKESLEMDIGQSEAIKSMAGTLANLQAALGISPMPPSITQNDSALSATQPGPTQGAPALVG